MLFSSHTAQRTAGSTCKASRIWSKARESLPPERPEKVKVSQREREIEIKRERVCEREKERVCVCV